MQNQQRNLIIWLLSSAVIMISWNFFFGRPPQKPPKPPSTLSTAPEGPPVREAQAACRLIASGFTSPGPGGPPVAPVFGLWGDGALMSLTFGYPTRFPLPPKIEAPPEKTPEVPEEQITLGDHENSKLQVLLNSRGGVVQSVVLNDFKAADDYGLPMYDADGKPQPLTLAPPHRVLTRKDNKVVYQSSLPSSHYTLYHYAKPDAEYPVDTLGKVVWKVEKRSLEDDEQSVTFGVDVPDQKVHVTKTFSLKPGDYHIGLKIGVTNTVADGKPIKFRYQFEGAHDLPIEGKWYTSIYRNALVGGEDKNHSAWRSLEDARLIGHWQGGESHDKQDNTIRYAGTATQYFASMVVVAEKENQPTGGDDFVKRVRATVEGPRNKEKPFLDDFVVRLISDPLTLEAGKPIEHDYLLYNGPLKVRLLGQLRGEQAVHPALVERYETKLGLASLTDYPSDSWPAQFSSLIGLTYLIIKVTNLLHFVLGWLYYTLGAVLPQFLLGGVCILLLTVMVRGVMSPLSYRQTKAMQETQDKMAKLAPEVKKLEAKHKDDPLALHQARNELYQRHGVNPLGAMGGCVLMFVQLPIFMGLYYALQESILFRLAPFLWIRNLAAPDMLFPWSESIYFISDPSAQGSFLYLGPYFNLLPVVAVALQLVQQRLTMPPAVDEQQKQQQEMMKYMMPILGLMFYKFASGMCLYFIAGSLWSLAERRLLPRKKTTTASAAPDGGAVAAVPPSSPPPRPKAPGGRGKNGRMKEEPRDGGLMQKFRDWVDDVLEQAKKK